MAIGGRGGRFKCSQLQYNRSPKGCRMQEGDVGTKGLYIPPIRPLPEKISATYDSSRMASTVSEKNEEALSAQVPIGMLDPSTLAKMPHKRDECDEDEDLPELQHILDCHTNLDQYSCQPPTPARSGNFDMHGQSNDMVTGPLSCGEKDDIFTNSDPPPGCFALPILAISAPTCPWTRVGRIFTTTCFSAQKSSKDNSKKPQFRKIGTGMRF